MMDSFPRIEIINKNEFFDFIDEFKSDEVQNCIELGDKIMVIYRTHQADINTMLDGFKQTHNVSIAIASAITAYARIHMSQFKNNPDFILYYSDTDSAYIDRPLSEDMISKTVLGKMKLENILTDAIFLAPKLYCLETEDGKIIHKVKGLNHNIDLTLSDFESLLYKDNYIQKLQTKWRKFLGDGHIKVLDELYTLKITENKRKLIYNNNNKLVGTVPYIINKDKEIINK